MATIADLTGETISSSYGTLLMVTETTGIDGTLRSVQDGLGAGTSALKLSTTVVSVDGNLAVGTESANVHSNYSTITIDGDAAGGSMVDLECNATRIASFYTNSSTDARIITHTSASLLLGANSTPSVYIADGGLVGIGGTPDTKLQIIGGHVAIDNAMGYQSFTNSGTRRNLITADSSDAITIGDTDFGKITIDSSGNVVMPTDTSDTSKSIRIGATDGTSGWSIGNGLTSAEHLFQVYDNTAGAARLTIDDGGSVGIGTAAPSNQLEIRSDLPVIRLTDENTTDDPYSTVSANGGHLILSADVTGLTNETFIAFEIDGSEQMKINDDGHVILTSVQIGDDGLASGTIYKDSSGFLKIA